MAVEAGARVLAVAPSDAKLALARELGAEVAVDYTRSDWIDRVREATGGGGHSGIRRGRWPTHTAAFDAMADGGRYVT